jgi:hypothetical protein
MTLEQGEVAAGEPEPVEGGDEADGGKPGAEEQTNAGEIESRSCRVCCQIKAALTHRGYSEQASPRPALQSPLRVLL